MALEANTVFYSPPLGRGREMGAMGRLCAALRPHPGTLGALSLGARKGNKWTQEGNFALGESPSLLEPTEHCVWPSACYGAWS